MVQLYKSSLKEFIVQTKFDFGGGCSFFKSEREQIEGVHGWDCREMSKWEWLKSSLRENLLAEETKNSLRTPLKMLLVNRINHQSSIPPPLCHVTAFDIQLEEEVSGAISFPRLCVIIHAPCGTTLYNPAIFYPVIYDQT